MQVTTDVIVAGSGMGAMVAARTLARRGAQVAVVDGAPALGGIGRSLEWDGYVLDPGCHLLGNTSDAVTETYLDLLDGAAVPVQPRVASLTDGVLTPGVEFPDLRRWVRRERGDALVDLLAAALTPAAPTDTDARTAHDVLVRRFGAPVATRLGAALRRITQRPLDALDERALCALPASRVLALEPELADALKAGHPALDAVLLRPRPDDPHAHLRARTSAWPARALYPAEGGIGGLAASGGRRLAALGVLLLLGHAITAIEVSDDKVLVHTATGTSVVAPRLVLALNEEVWAPLAGLDATGLREGVVPVPAVVAWYAVPEGAHGDAIHWLHAYDGDQLAFRVSFPTTYGPGLAPAGRSVVVAEMLTAEGTDTWDEPDRAAATCWDQIRRLGLVTGEPDAVLVKRFGTTYRFPAAGLGARTAHLRRWLSEHGNVVAQDGWLFTKDALAASMIEACGRLLGGS
jgi:phytoene dehydrogenase-like protein